MQWQDWAWCLRFMTNCSAKIWTTMPSWFIRVIQLLSHGTTSGVIFQEVVNEFQVGYEIINIYSVGWFSCSSLFLCRQQSGYSKFSVIFISRMVTMITMVWRVTPLGHARKNSAYVTCLWRHSLSRNGVACGLVSLSSPSLHFFLYCLLSKGAGRTKLLYTAHIAALGVPSVLLYYVDLCLWCCNFMFTFDSLSFECRQIRNPVASVKPTLRTHIFTL